VRQLAQHLPREQSLQGEREKELAVVRTSSSSGSLFGLSGSSPISVSSSRDICVSLSSAACVRATPRQNVKKNAKPRAASSRVRSPPAVSPLAQPKTCAAPRMGRIWAAGGGGGGWGDLEGGAHLVRLLVVVPHACEMHPRRGQWAAFLEAAALPAGWVLKQRRLPRKVRGSWRKRRRGKSGRSTRTCGEVTRAVSSRLEHARRQRENGEARDRRASLATTEL